MIFTAKTLLLLVLSVLPGANAARTKSYSPESGKKSKRYGCIGGNCASPLEMIPLDAPFDISFTVTNKEEVMDAKWSEWFGSLFAFGARFGSVLKSPLSDSGFTDHLVGKLIELLPASMQAAGVTVSAKTQKVDGLSARLTLQIQGYDPALWNDFEYSDHLAALKAVLQDLGVGNQYVEQVKTVTSGDLRHELMQRMPSLLKQKLEEDFAVKCEPRIEPTKHHYATAGLPQVLQQVRPPRKLHYRISISKAAAAAEGEEDVGEEAGEEQLEPDTPRLIPGAKFWSMFMGKLDDKQMPVKLGARLPGSPEVVSFTAYADWDAIDGGKKSFWFVLEVDDVEVDKTLKLIGDPSFMDKYHKTLAEVAWFRPADIAEDDDESSEGRWSDQLLGDEFQGIHNKIWDIIKANIHAKMWEIAMADLQANVPEQLKKALGADVQLMNEEVFHEVKSRVAKGRCCGTAAGIETSGHLFFVDKTMLNYGSGHGHCPNVNVERVCKEKGFAKPVMLSMTVPEGAVEGEKMLIASPFGGKLKFTCPPGVVPGQELKVEAPAPPFAANTQFRPIMDCFQVKSQQLEQTAVSVKEPCTDIEEQPEETEVEEPAQEASTSQQ